MLVLGILSHSAATSNPNNEAKCFVGAVGVDGTNFDEEDASKFTSLVCEEVGVDGKSLTEVIQKIYRKYDNRTFTIDELGPQIKALTVLTRKNATIAQDSFTKFTRLESLKLYDASPTTGESTVTIAANALASLKNIREVILVRQNINPASVANLAEIADSVSQLRVVQSVPSVEILTQIGKFTNLSEVELNFMCKDGPPPESTFKNSAAKLKTLHIRWCESSTALTANMFRGMSSLTEFWWAISNVTGIESGAFDDFSNVEAIVLNGDGLKSLPDGLFSKTTNLKMVSLCDKLHH